MSNGVVGGGRSRQSGVALLALVALLSLWGMYLLLGQLNVGQLRMVHQREASLALAEARDALIGDAIGQPLLADAGYLRLPDLGFRAGRLSEGESALTFAGDGKDLSVIGKFPWQTLRTAALRDAQGECLWYVVSGRFKNDAWKTDPLNWDTQGQIDVVNEAGSPLANDVAALLVAPGPALDGQQRRLAETAYAACGGNYDARNYLDPFMAANALAGQVNYFAGSTNNRVAPNSGNKAFVVASTDHYNDRFLYVTVDDIFNRLILRSDFVLAVHELLASQAFIDHLRSIAVAGSKGGDNIACTSAPNPGFCKNWKEMLFLTQLSQPSPITVNGLPTSLACSRVLIFAGRKTAAQRRRTAAEKADRSNYLEDLNLASFRVPSTSATAFSGSTGDFSAASASTDLVRCLP